MEELLCFADNVEVNWMESQNFAVNVERRHAQTQTINQIPANPICRQGKNL